MMAGFLESFVDVWLAILAVLAIVVSLGAIFIVGIAIGHYVHWGAALAVVALLYTIALAAMFR